MTNTDADAQPGLTPDRWFATPVWSRKVVEFERVNNELLAHLAEIEQRAPRSLRRSNVGGWHSDDQLHQLPGFHEIAQIIGKTCAACAAHLNFDFEKFELVMKEMWLNKNATHQFNRAHLHPNSMLSGSYYVQTPENCGNIELLDPVSLRTMNIYPTVGTKATNRQQVEYPADAGSLLIFPSWLQHSVQPNLGEGMRVSLSFNVSYRQKVTDNG